MKLVQPTKAWKAQAISFKQEFFDYGEAVIDGSDLWDQMDSYEEWLCALEKNSNKETCDPNWVVSHTWFGVIEHEIVGIIDFRPCLNQKLQNIGHIGYSVRPTKRRQGYAKAMLGMVLNIAKETGNTQVTISCLHDNIASAKTIKALGGQLFGTFEYQRKSADRYIIDLKKNKDVF